MKAIAVFPKNREVKLIDHPEPRITQASEVKIRMIEVGVCGTDREIWNFEYGTPPADCDYLITGHESVGEIIQVGPGVKELAAGDLVVPTVRRGCPENCISCAQMRPDFCFTGHYTERGIKQAHGYMTEYVVDDAKYMSKIPVQLKDDAVLLEPLTITEKALIEVSFIQGRLPPECRIERGVTDNACRNTLVLGAGPVGILGAMALKNLNMNVAVVARKQKPNAKADLLSSLDIDYYSTEDFSPSQIAAHVGNVDLILEATGAAQVSYDFLQILGTNGIFIFTGVPGLGKEITIDAGTLMRNAVLKNQVVLGTVNAPKAAFENGIKDMEDFNRKWPKQLKSLVTSRIPVDEYRELLRGRGTDEIKTVFTLNF